MDTLSLEYVFTLRVNVGTVVILGQTAKGTRRMVPIVGGLFEGPAIRGEIVAGGYDWQIGRTDGVTEVEARYLLKTDDGVLINIVNQGLRHGPPEVLQRLSRGEAVDPSLYYFRSVFTFETADDRYQWLSQSVFLATGSRLPDCVLIRVFKVL